METKLFSLENKVALITGSGSGIGRAIAELFAQQGAQVCLLEINEQAASQTQQAIHARNGKAEIFACNVANQREVMDAVASISHRYGKLDILVNSAGIAHIGKLTTTNETDFERLFQVNVKGVYNCMLAAVEVMLSQKQGVILNVASVASSVGISERFAYSMTKGAVVSMTLSVAKDYIK